jgi:hypothetical protein
VVAKIRAVLTGAHHARGENTVSPVPRTTEQPPTGQPLSRRAAFGPGLAAALLGGSVLLSGCGFPSIGGMSPKLPSSRTAAVAHPAGASSPTAPTPAPPSRAAVVFAPARGDLAWVWVSRRLLMGNGGVALN